MSSDPAELIFYGELNAQAIFDEARRLGISVERLQDEETRQHVLHSRLVRLRTETAKDVAAGLGIPITEEQAVSIAKNSLVPEVLVDPAPLTPEERAIAVELYFHAIKAAVARHEGLIRDKKARAEAEKMATAGERGLTNLQRISRATGCLVVAGAVGLGATSVLLSVLAVILSA